MTFGQISHNFYVDVDSDPEVFLSVLMQNGEVCSADASARSPLMRCSHLELWKLFSGLPCDTCDDGSWGPCTGTGPCRSRLSDCRCSADVLWSYTSIKQFPKQQNHQQQQTNKQTNKQSRVSQVVFAFRESQPWRFPPLLRAAAGVLRLAGVLSGSAQRAAWRCGSWRVSKKSSGIVVVS